ncbi:Rad17 cell cycle checkpoint protein-domain-containing protein [Aspergillus multicolor]|uniref:putative cell cycle checkpoint protein Rad17 n=1 Tax=Aspergillus multicolor TaxID=41759 RepID=UPI003CCE1C17
MKNKDKTQHSSNISLRETLQKNTELDGPNRRWPAKWEMSGSAGPAFMDDDEDLIEDDYDSYDELFTQHFTDDNLSQLDGTKIASPPQARANFPVRNVKSPQKPASSTRRFSSKPKPSSGHGSLSPSSTGKEALPWAQRYPPLSLGELAVHKGKVRDVEQWLNGAFAGKAGRGLLVLKGPAGSGKTTTISLLSRSLNFDILEWKAPPVSTYTAKDYVSLGAQFDGFLSRGHGFGSLDLDGHDESQTLIEGNIYAPRRIILIEEFPTLSGQSAAVLAAFRLSILRYISMNASPSKNDYSGTSGVPPIVMIVSEIFSNSESSFDNLTVHRLLGRDIYNHPSTTIIEFNSIAPTFMNKALDLVLKKSVRQPTGNQAATQSIIEDLSKLGDIRNAIASLEFLCCGSGNKSYWSDPTAKSKRISRARKNLSTGNSGVPEVMAQREASLGLFHAVGKIIYNKRSDTSDVEHPQLPPPPDYPRRLDRRGVSLVQVNELYDETGTDIQPFISTLHENYVPSCNGPSFTECLEGCIECLSDSDLLCVERKWHSRSQAGLGLGSVRWMAGSVDLLRQEELSYQVAARGLLFNLPTPVKRQLRRANDSHKVFFSPALRLVRQLEDIQNDINAWKDTLGSTLPQTSVPPATQRQPASNKFPRETMSNPGCISDKNSFAIIAMKSRSDLILYQLPYMAMIVGKSTESESLRRITTIGTRGIDISSQQDDYVSGASLQEYDAFRISKNGEPGGPLGQQTPLFSQTNDGRLILSDDDIEDDPT